MTKHRMHYLASLLLPALAPACATDSLSSSTQAVGQSTTTRVYEEIRCDVDLCILHDQQDSDGDGIADIDEKAIGTNPQVPWDRPAIVDLAALVPQHALPSFETGNSMLIVLPTKDANGLPVFGGDALTGSRQTSLERAGISVPGGMDLGRGFTLTRSMSDMKLQGHDLLWAVGGSIDVKVSNSAARGFGSVVDVYSDVQQTYSYSNNDGKNTYSGFTGTDDHGHETRVTNDTTPTDEHTHTEHTDGTGSSDVLTHKDADGNTFTTSSSDYTWTEDRSGGEHKVHETTKTESAVSHDGRTTFSTTTTTRTETNSSGVTTTTVTTKTKSCTDGECTTGSGDGTPVDDGETVAYRDPNYDGDVPVTPQLMHDVLVARGANVDVVNPANGPIVTYSYTPQDAGNRWGPVALVAGDDNDGTVGTPSVIHVPSAQPEYDPSLEHGVPPPSIPPNSGGMCTYCAQP